MSVTLRNHPDRAPGTAHLRCARAHPAASLGDQDGAHPGPAGRPGAAVLPASCAPQREAVARELAAVSAGSDAPDPAGRQRQPHRRHRPQHPAAPPPRRSPPRTSTPGSCTTRWTSPRWTRPRGAARTAGWSSSPPCTARCARATRSRRTACRWASTSARSARSPPSGASPWPTCSPRWPAAASSSTAAPARTPPRGRRRARSRSAGCRSACPARRTWPSTPAAWSRATCARWAPTRGRRRRCRRWWSEAFATTLTPPRRPGQPWVLDAGAPVTAADSCSTWPERVGPVMVFLVAITVVAEIADVAGRLRRRRPLGRAARPAPHAAALAPAGAAVVPGDHRPQPRHHRGAADAGGHRRRPPARAQRRALRDDDGLAGQHGVTAAARLQPHEPAGAAPLLAAGAGHAGYLRLALWPALASIAASVVVLAVLHRRSLRGRYELDAPPEPHDRSCSRGRARCASRSARRSSAGSPPPSRRPSPRWSSPAVLRRAQPADAAPGQGAVAGGPRRLRALRRRGRRRPARARTRC